MITSLSARTRRRSCLFGGLLALFFVQTGFAQKLSWHADIQPILYKHCAGCHRPGEIAPFSLLSYNDVAQRAEMIRRVISEGYMPPWFADPNFQSHKNERLLPPEDAEKIKRWIAEGKKEGKAPKSKPSETLVLQYAGLQAPDIELEMADTFTIPGDNKEHFRLFVIPSRSTEDWYIRGMEYVPGNRRLSHHCRMMLDTSRLMRRDHGKEVGEVPDFEQINTPMFDNFWQGWAPGNLPVFYPDSLAKFLPKGADIVLNVHYSPSPVPAFDRPKIRLWLAPRAPKKVVQTATLGENAIANQPFFIPAHAQPTFFLRSQVLAYDIHILSVLPHMHLLGRAFKAFAITPGGDLLPLVKIDRWDFKWQTSYQMKSPLLVPKGSVIYAEATYDNTPDNPSNPFSPPRNISYGWGTNDEMMNLIIEYVR